MKANIKFQTQDKSMDVEVDGTSREVASLIKELHASSDFSGEKGEASIDTDHAAPRSPEDTPGIEEVTEAIRKHPKREHTAKRLMEHFFGEPVPTRKEGASNPDYLRFLHRVKKARESIEEDEGVKFVETGKEGREKVYQAEKT